jgi:hypothetical protein
MSTVSIAAPEGSATQHSAETYRMAWTLSPTGVAAVCMVLEPGAEPSLEVRRPFSSSHRKILAVPGLRPESPLAVDDSGTVTAAVLDDDHWQPLELRTDGTRCQWVGRVPAAARLQPGPDGRWLAHQPYGSSTRIYQVTPSGTTVLCEVDYRVQAAHRWDADTVLLNVIERSGHVGAIRVDVSTGGAEDFYTVSDRSDDRIVKVLPAADLVIVSTTASGEPRIGWGRVSEGRISFPGCRVK